MVWVGVEGVRAGPGKARGEGFKTYRGLGEYGDGCELSG